MSPFTWVIIGVVIIVIMVFYNQRKPPDGDGVYSEGVEFEL